VGLDLRVACGQLTLIRVEELKVLVEHEDLLAAVMSGERRLMSASEAWRADD
jgi:hypothetical protein